MCILVLFCMYWFVGCLIWFALFYFVYELFACSSYMCVIYCWVCCFCLITWWLLRMGSLWSVLLWLVIWACWFVEFFELFVFYCYRERLGVLVWLWCRFGFVLFRLCRLVDLLACVLFRWVGMFTVRFIGWLYCLVGSLFWLLVFGLVLLLTLSFLVGLLLW